MRILPAACLLSLAMPASAQIVRVGDLNTTQIRALDRSKTVVLLTGGMLEEHGPYLPAGTDAILSSQLALEVAQSIVAKKPGWTVLAFPQIPFGSAGSNESAGDTYGGRMVNLWDLVPVISGWGNAMVSAMTDAEKKVDGASLHGGMDEHSLMLHLNPQLVSPGYASAPAVTGQTTEESFAEAKKPGWPGYLGAPRLATAALGGKIWKAFSAAASEQTLKILDGADPFAIPRYADILEKNPLYQRDWIGPAKAHDEALEAKEREWLRRKPR